MTIADNNGVEIYYEKHGEGSPLVFLHGSGGNHAVWWQQVGPLCKTHTVVTIDLRGFGSSSREGDILDSRDHPSDILAVLDDAGLTDATLVGLSIGANAALRAALRAPARIRGVILAHSFGDIDNADLAELAAQARINAEKIPILERLLGETLPRADPAKAFLFRQMGTLNLTKATDLRNLMDGRPLPSEILAAGVRVAFLTGEHDPIATPATIAKAHDLLPGSLLEIVPGAAHSMYWGDPELFNTAVLRLSAALEPVEAAQ